MSITLGVQLGALANRPQRQVLVELFNHNSRDDVPADSEDEELMLQEEELEKFLDYQHIHLLELERKGLIDYDRENHTLSKGPNFDEIEPLVELIVEHQDELPDDWL